MEPSTLTGQQPDFQRSEENIMVEPREPINRFVALGVAQRSLKGLKNILNQVAGFFQLSEEEKHKAGIYLGDRHYE